MAKKTDRPKDTLNGVGRGGFVRRSNLLKGKNETYFLWEETQTLHRVAGLTLRVRDSLFSQRIR